MIIRLAKLRKERSAEAARARRNKENGEYDNIKKLLPIDESKLRTKEHRTFFVRERPNIFDVRTMFFWCSIIFLIRVISSYKNMIENVPRTVFVFLAVVLYRTFVFVFACRKDGSLNIISVHWSIILTIVSPGLLGSTTLNSEVKQI